MNYKKYKKCRLHFLIKHATVTMTTAEPGPLYGRMALFIHGISFR